MHAQTIILVYNMYRSDDKLVDFVNSFVDKKIYVL